MYDPKNKLPTHEAILPNQREKKAKALESTVCVTKQDNQNNTPSHKELLQWNFRLGDIGFQHVQWILRKVSLKVQGNDKAVDNYEGPKYAACDFGKGNC